MTYQLLDIFQFFSFCFKWNFKFEEELNKDLNSIDKITQDFLLPMNEVNAILITPYVPIENRLFSNEETDYIRYV